MTRKAQLVCTARKRGRILLVDDHPLVRERLAEIINREADLLVTGEAEDRKQAIDAILAKPPDLAIVDLTLKNSDGLELIKDVHARWPRMRMLVYSALSGLGAALLFFGGRSGIAEADTVGPSLPLPNLDSWTTWVVVAVCVVAIVAVAVGIFFIVRARAKRRASGPDAGR